MAPLKPRLRMPRLPPLDPAAFDETMRTVLAPRPAAYGGPDAPVFNVFRTMAHHSALAKRMSPWGGHVLFKSSLAPREREMTILRTGWVCACAYEFAHHAALALEEGALAADEIERIKIGTGAPGNSERDDAILAAVDELLEDHFIATRTWDVLARTMSTHQLMDLVFAVGHYAMMCKALNTFGVQLEPEFDQQEIAS